MSRNSCSARRHHYVAAAATVGAGITIQTGIYGKTYAERLGK